MSDSATPTTPGLNAAPGGQATCGPLQEAMLNLYVDGELEPDREPALLAHLDACRACQAQHDALLAFRRALGEEPLVVPAALDAAILARATAARKKPHPYTAARRAEDRQPLAAMRRRHRWGTGWVAIAVVAAVALGTWLARPTPEPAAPIVQQRPQEETLETAPVYVIYPGLTVEDDREQP